MKYEREYLVKRTLQKDILHKKLAGVCAGIAKHYNFPRIAVRIVAIGSLILLPVATGVAYVVASILLPNSKY